MKNLIAFLVVAAIACSILGCGKKKPADMPDLVPFKVKVVDGSTPIEGVQVLLTYDKNPVITGVTDKSGVAELTTTLQGYTSKGAPKGDFRVACIKEPFLEHWKTPQERAMMDPGQAGEYNKEYQAKLAEIPREVPASWADSMQSGLTLTIDGSTDEATFDVDGHAND